MVYKLLYRKRNQKRYYIFKTRKLNLKGDADRLKKIATVDFPNRVFKIKKY